MNGKQMKWVHATFVIIFTCIWTTAAFAGWLASVVFVSHMSMIALVYAAASAWQAARTEEKEDERDS